MAETPQVPEDAATPDAPKEAADTTPAPEASEATEVAAPPAEAPVEKPAVSSGPKKLPKGQHWWRGTGRRKTAVARVRLRPGKGEIKVNNRDLNEYFTEERDQNDVKNVLNKTNIAGNVDVFVKVHGGGYMGQAGAIVLGLGRAIKLYDESLEPILRDNNFLTRDARQVERKKPGQKGARARFQFSKR